LISPPYCQAHLQFTQAKAQTKNCKRACLIISPHIDPSISVETDPPVSVDIDPPVSVDIDPGVSL